MAKRSTRANRLAPEPDKRWFCPPGRWTGSPLAEQGLARRDGDKVTIGRNLVGTLRSREVDAVGRRLASETGLAHLPAEAGEPVAGTYRQRLSLASGRFAMIDNGLGFQLVPWIPSLERELGRQVNGIASPGGVEWSFGRKRDLSL
jgi:hypothetical protein